MLHKKCLHWSELLNLKKNLEGLGNAKNITLQ